MTAGVAVADLLARADLGLAVEVEGARDRPVRWVSVSELDDPAQYLEGGELLLTTGLTDHEWAGYVARLVAAGVTALGFGIGVRHEAVPAGLRAAAAERGMIVLTVPERTPFNAVSTAVADLLAEVEGRATAAALELQRLLSRDALRPDGPRRVLARLGRATGGRVQMVDGSGRLPAGGPTELGVTARALLAKVSTGPRAAATETGGAGTVVVQPLGLERFLVLEAAGLDAVGRAGLVAAVTLLSLHDEIAAARREGARQVRAVVVDLLLAGSSDTARLLAARIDDTLPGRLRVLSLDRPVLVEGGELARTAEDGIAVLVVAADGALALAGRLATRGRRVGVGREVGLDEVAASHATARAALARATPDCPLANWDETSACGFGGLLAGAGELAGHTLGPVGRDPELRHTLRTHLAHLGRIRPTAQALGIHRNTLRARLDRIAALLGRDLDDPDVRAELWLALRASAP